MLRYIILILLLYSCQAPVPRPKASKIVEAQPDLYRFLKQHAAALDSASKIDSDTLDSLNERLKQTIERHKAEFLSLKDTTLFDFLNVLVSSNRKLCLISWDTRMGGTMIDFTTTVIYTKADGSLIAKVLLDTTAEDTDNTPMYYDQLYSIPGKNGMNYVAVGNGQGSTALPYGEVRALRINKDQLLDAPLFPGRKSFVFVEFDTHHLKGDIPSISVSDSGRRIAIPVSDGDEGFANRYETLVYKNGVYSRK